MDTSEEIGVCEFCEHIGLREGFYSNSKRFCSITCSHSFSAQHRFGSKSGGAQGKSGGAQGKSGGAQGKSGVTLGKSGGGTKSKNVKPQNLKLPSESKRHQCITLGFDWGAYLVSKKSIAASVELFQHAPMSGHWGEVGSCMKVEVQNLDCNLNTKVFWIASVVQVAGYKAKLRYEGFGDDNSCDFWCNLCTLDLDVNAVGWCATIGKPLVPPQTVQHKYNNWKSFLVKRLTGAKTLPNDFQKRVVDSVKSPFLCNMRLEVVDKTRISRMRVGIIREIIGGRLRLRYEDSDYEHDDFWCHSRSSLLHPIGWCEKVGHKILVASKDYKTKKGFKNARQELFQPVKQVKSCGFKVGMKLEAIDPLNLSAICVATVKKVLKNGYVMIGIDGSEAADGSDWFCYHCTAPSIFPVGFCMENKISLSVPKAYKDNFSWEDYLGETNSQAAPVEHFEANLPDHGFKPGMKLEAVDLMEPRLICVATVTKVIGRLLHVHFDGWENQYDQWVDCRSPDIYPVGWCELVGCELQRPPNMLIPADGGTAKKKKLRGQSFATKKKRKRSSAGQKKVDSLDNQQNSSLVEDKIGDETDTQQPSTDGQEILNKATETSATDAEKKEEAPYQSQSNEKADETDEKQTIANSQENKISSGAQSGEDVASRKDSTEVSETQDNESREEQSEISTEQDQQHIAETEQNMDEGKSQVSMEKQDVDASDILPTKEGDSESIAETERNADETKNHVNMEKQDTDASDILPTKEGDSESIAETERIADEAKSQVHMENQDPDTSDILRTKEGDTENIQEEEKMDISLHEQVATDGDSAVKSEETADNLEMPNIETELTTNQESEEQGDTMDVDESALRSVDEAKEES